MHMIHYIIGETKFWRAVPQDAGGQMTDLDGASAELRITISKDLCLLVGAEPDDRGFPFGLPPEKWSSLK